MNPTIMFATIAGGGKIVAGKPTLFHTATNQFTIQNYDSTFIYTVTNGTRSGSIVTPSSASTVCTVLARAPKGLVNSTSSTCEYRTITFSWVGNFVITNFYNHGRLFGGVCHTNTCGSCPGANGVGCSAACSFAPGDTCNHQDGYISCSQVENPPPSGFTKAFGQWARTT